VSFLHHPIVFLTVLFAIILFGIESGTPCFVGDPGCVVPASLQGRVEIGDRIIVNKLGESSQIPDVFYGLWFSFVTLTTTGLVGSRRACATALL
jgi:hypothetical protein